MAIKVLKPCSNRPFYSRRKFHDFSIFLVKSPFNDSNFNMKCKYEYIFVFVNLPTIYRYFQVYIIYG